MSAKIINKAIEESDELMERITLQAKLAIAREALEYIARERNPNIYTCIDKADKALAQLDQKPLAVVEVNCKKNYDDQWIQTTFQGPVNPGILIVLPKETK